MVKRSHQVFLPLHGINHWHSDDSQNEEEKKDFVLTIPKIAFMYWMWSHGTKGRHCGLSSKVYVGIRNCIASDLDAIGQVFDLWILYGDG